MLGVVFVHGFRSSPGMWDPFTRLMTSDADLSHVVILRFAYTTKIAQPHPLRALPSFDTVADSLKEFLDTEAEGLERLVLVSHSQGGLVTQRFLTRMLAEGRGKDLRRIRRVVMLACPNTGSQVGLLLRRTLLRANPQERQLRPFDEQIADTRRTVLRDIVNARTVTARTCPIAFSVYAGESDAVVTPASARDAFPDAAVLPGDHLSIARPRDLSDRSYTTVKRHVLDAAGKAARAGSHGDARNAAHDEAPDGAPGRTAKAPRFPDGSAPRSATTTRPPRESGAGGTADPPGGARELHPAALPFPAPDRRHRPVPRRGLLIGSAAAVLSTGTGGALLLEERRPSSPSLPGVTPYPVHAAAPVDPPLLGHTDLVVCLAFSPDGSTLASGSWDRTIRLWKTDVPARARLLRPVLTSHEDHVEALAFAPDGRTLASGSDDTTVRLWRVGGPTTHAATGAATLLGHTDAVNAVSYAPDGRTLASGSDDTTVRLWDVGQGSSGGRLAVLPNQHGDDDVVRSVAFAPRGGLLASGSQDGAIRLWKAADPDRPERAGLPFTAHTDIVNTVAFHPRGHLLASGGNDRTVRLWDVSGPGGPRALGPPLQGHAGSVTSVAFSPDGNTLASGSYDATVRLWDVSAPAVPVAIGTALSGHSHVVFAVAFSHDGRTLASASGDRTIRLWTLT